MQSLFLHCCLLKKQKLHGFVTNHCKTDKSTEPDESSQKAPEFIIPPRNLHVKDGATATLSCRVTGEPPPSVQWQKGRQILRHGKKHKVSDYLIG